MTDTNNKKMTGDPRNPEWLPITLRNVVEDIASGVSFEEFLSTIEILQKKPKAAHKLYSMQKTALEHDINQSIDYMYQEHNIGENYNAISKLISTSTDVKKWRPIAGDYNMQYDPYKRKVLLEKKQKLENMLQETRNLRLMLEASQDKKREKMQIQIDQLINAQKQLEHYDQLL